MSGFQHRNVSRETYERLELYVELVKKWNKAINLVSRSTVADIWNRHIQDSVQLLTLNDKSNFHWVDIGSGGGLPGMVIATFCAEHSPESKITLIESDQRKAAFLRTASQELGLHVEVFSKRIEEVEPQDADILSARALAPLDILLGFASRHLSQDGVAIFPKGAGYKAELEKAAKAWKFDVETRQSLTDNTARILMIKEIERA